VIVVPVPTAAQAVRLAVDAASAPTVAIVTIDVLDTYPAMHRILTSPLDARPAQLEEMLRPVEGMYRHFPGERDLVALHHMGAGFRVDRDDPAALPALVALRPAWDRVATALDDALAVQLAATPAVAVPDIQVVIVLGDSSDAHFMDVNLGMSANGSTTGYLWLNFWPSPENLARVEATAVHELNHNLRYATSAWNPATVTVGEQVVSEGLADAFARQLYGELGYTRIGVAAQHDDAVYEKVVAGLGITGMRNFAAYVHGDATAARFGGTPVGLPTGAGYAVGNRLVDAYLDRTGQTAAEALLADAAEVIRVAQATR
jgi:uncharacterized protein YjaZ